MARRSASCRIPAPPPWWLPLLCALLPFIAGHVALWLSIRDGLIEACLPHVEGCVSISRAARHGWGNVVFKAMMWPAAALQAGFWWRTRGWLRARAGVDSAALAWPGVVACLFLALYVSFLGSEGEVYRLLRRYGITVYFGGTFLALMAVLRRMSQAWRSASAFMPLRIVAMGMLALGVASVAVSATVTDRAARDLWENRLEWQLGLWLTAMFLAFALAWWRERLLVALR